MPIIAEQGSRRRRKQSRRVAERISRRANQALMPPPATTGPARMDTSSEFRMQDASNALDLYRQGYYLDPKTREVRGGPSAESRVRGVGNSLLTGLFGETPLENLAGAAMFALPGGPRGLGEEGAAVGAGRVGDIGRVEGEGGGGREFKLSEETRAKMAESAKTRGARNRARRTQRAERRTVGREYWQGTRDPEALAQSRADIQEQVGALKPKAEPGQKARIKADKKTWADKNAYQLLIDNLTRAPDTPPTLPGREVTNKAYAAAEAQLVKHLTENGYLKPDEYAIVGEEALTKGLITAMTDAVAEADAPFRHTQPFGGAKAEFRRTLRQGAEGNPENLSRISDAEQKAITKRVEEFLASRAPESRVASPEGMEKYQQGVMRFRELKELAGERFGRQPPGRKMMEGPSNPDPFRWPKEIAKDPSVPGQGLRFGKGRRPPEERSVLGGERFFGDPITVGREPVPQDYFTAEETPRQLPYREGGTGPFAEVMNPESGTGVLPQNLSLPDLESVFQDLRYEIQAAHQEGNAQALHDLTQEQYIVVRELQRRYSALGPHLEGRRSNVSAPEATPVQEESMLDQMKSLLGL